MKNAIFSAAMLLAAMLAANADSQTQPAEQSSATRTTGDKTVKLCDNKTTVQVPNDAPKTRAEGQRISDALMAQWKASNPNSDWVQGEVEAHQVVAPADNTKLIGTGQSSLPGSAGSNPAMTWSMSAMSSALRVIGPIWSMVKVLGKTPRRLTLP